VDWERFKRDLLSDDTYVVAEAVRSLAALGPGDDPLDGLIATVHDGTFAPFLPALFDALVACGIEVEALMTLATSRRPALQIEGARALGVLGDPTAAPLLEKRTTSKRAALREAATVALEAVRSGRDLTPRAPPPPSAPQKTPSMEARDAIEALRGGDETVIQGLFEFLCDRESENEEPRAPEHPRAPVESEVVEALAQFAAMNELHLVSIADVLHALRRGRFGCSVGAEFAAKRAIDDLTGTQLISSYRAWREDHTGEEAVDSGISPVARRAPARSPPRSVVPTPVTVAPTPAVRRSTPTKRPTATPTPTPTRTDAPAGEPLSPSDYWDRPPRRKKPWWKFW
jgi:hypothetical protein